LLQEVTITAKNESYLTANNASTIAQQTLRNKPQTKQLLSISWQSVHRTACKATAAENRASVDALRNAFQ